MVGEARGSRRVMCRYHCAVCGRHFSSLEAFCEHRAGEYVEGRHCVSPLDLAEHLVTATAEGFCRISGEHTNGSPLTLHPVIVWSSARLLGRAVQAFSERAEALA
jgi:hypothetical protein